MFTKQHGSALLMVVFVMLFVSAAATLVGAICTKSAQGVSTAYHQTQLRFASKGALEYATAYIVQHQTCPEPLSSLPAVTEYQLEMQCSLGSRSYLDAPHQGCDVKDPMKECFFYIKATAIYDAKPNIITRTLQAEIKVSPVFK